MELTYQQPLQMPSCYAVLTEEEMTYIDGGFTFTLGNYEVNVDTAALMQNLVANLVVVAINFGVAVGRYAFQATMDRVQVGMSDGLGASGIVRHFWGSLNTTSKVISIGTTALAGYYGYLQVRSIVLSLKNIFDAFKNTYDQYLADQQAAAAGAA